MGETHIQPVDDITLSVWLCASILLTLILCAVVWLILVAISKMYDPQSDFNRIYQIERRRYNRRNNNPNK